MTDIEFQPFPKIARLNRPVVITEKIDGTNAAVGITDDGAVYAQSRKRLVTPDDDNFGFARWVADNAGALTDLLGPGLHFGEWWGSGIQRGYGLTGGEKRFSLFNVSRWGEAGHLWAVPGLGVVPVLDRADTLSDSSTLHDVLWQMREMGSLAAPGFMQPEGIVLYHGHSNMLFKVTLENDEEPKSVVRARGAAA